MVDKKRKVVSLPSYTGDLSKLFDFEHALSEKQAYAFHKKHQQVMRKLTREFRLRYREEMSR